MRDFAFYETIKELCYLRHQRPEVITRTECLNGEECVVIFDDIEKGFYKLTGNAGRIWNMLDGQTSLAAIVAQLQQESSENRERIIEDVCTFIYKIGKKGLIKAAIKQIPPQPDQQI